MNKLTRAVGIALVLGGASVGISKSLVFAQANSSSRAAAWEYHVTGEISQDSLTQLGSKGWELIAVTVGAAQAPSRINGEIGIQCMGGMGDMCFPGRPSQFSATLELRSSMYFKRSK
jgi:hypothetical protein